MLTIYNSLTKQKEEFHPITPNKVRMYVCGITAYDFSHIGHARSVGAFPDIIVRYLRYRGYDVTYVRNFTDIDDKIIQRANENGEPFQQLTSRFIQAMHEDMAALAVLPPDIEPMATAYVPHMITMIQTLLDKDFAYIGASGDVYYRVERFPEYGKLAHKTLSDLQAGSRVSIVEEKDNPLDFVLWKMAKPGEPAWESPWGKGRPGWHIECSAMSTHCLGDNFDIHAGGGDLKFPHHENEIAQSEAATGKKFANYWLHTGMVNVNQEKMSKSLGNFFTIRDVLAQYRPEVVRYFLICSHYRSPVNYSQESLDSATQALVRFYTTLRGLDINVVAPKDSEFEQRFMAAMDDDFNTPEALAVLFDITHEINRLRQTDIAQATELAALLLKLGHVLGILKDSPETFLRGPQNDEAVEIEKLIAARAAARQAKNWAEADKIRQQLADMKVTIEDTTEGTLWRKA